MPEDAFKLTAAEKAQRARQSLPLDALMQRYGDAPKRCPFCPPAHNNSGGLFQKAGVTLFKCFHTSCPTGNKVLDEVGYLMMKHACDRREAFKTWLKESGHWEEPARKRRKEKAPPSEPARDPVPLTEPSAADLAAQEEALLTARGTASADGADDVAPVPAEPPPTPAGTGGVSNGGPSAPDQPSPEDEAGLTAARQALRRFYDQLVLSDRDREALRVKRGLSDAAIDRMGFRSSPRSNLALLQSLAPEFDETALVRSGLWTRTVRTVKPNRIFHGWGRIRKLTKQEQVDGREWEEGWCEPVLIPYFGPDGTLHALRPHKDNVKGASALFYVPPGGYEPHADGVLTEGEFKAAALQEVLGGTHAVGALPGISMSKTESVLAGIKEWIERTQVKRVLVAFDNEDKATPGLPGYKAQKWKRFDTLKWAGYLALVLPTLGVEAQVVVLPDEWREDGKADWDSALAMQGVERARSEWPRVLRDRAIASTEFERRDLFGYVSGRLPVLLGGDEEALRMVRNGVERLRYQPLLPHGGRDEAKMTAWLRRVVSENRHQISPSWVGRLTALANEFEKVAGWYYSRRPYKPQGKEAEELQNMLAFFGPGTDVGRAVREFVLGVPQQVGDFEVRCHYVLVKVNGHRDRIVTLVNSQGEESRMVSLDERSMTAPRDWRAWLAQQGNYTWMAGERELQALQRDINHSAAFKDVLQVAIRGWHTETGLWFFEDAAVLPDGTLLLPEHGIFWHGGQGYMVGNRDGEDEPFSQGVPRLHPHREDPPGLEALFGEVSTRFHESLGGYEAEMSIGLVLGQLAAPELYKHYSCVPGLWVHGEQGQGKSSVARWLMRLLGFAVEAGIPLNRTTDVGMALAATQYSNLLCWFEEFQPDTRKSQQDIIKNAFNRESGAKKTFGEARRVIRSAFMVTGVATSPDGQTRSRYGHVKVSSTNRQGDHYDWMQEHSADFYLFGRRLLRRRSEYAAAVMEEFHSWVADGSLKADDRAKKVQALAFAGYAVAARMFGTRTEEQLAQYREWCRAHCLSSAAEVQESVNVNAIWQDILAALEMGAFGETVEEIRRVFHITVTRADHPPGAPLQTVNIANGQPGWDSVRLVFKPELLLQLLQKELRRQGRDVTLSRNDLKAQMSVKPYWGGVRDARFSGGPTQGWSVELDRHDLGYQPISDGEYADRVLPVYVCAGVLGSDNHACAREEIFSEEEYRAGRKCPACGGWKWTRQWPDDPRLGPLYAIVRRCESRKKEEEH